MRGLARKKGQKQKGANMLEWLKEILENGDTAEEKAAAITKKIGEGFVARNDFNEKNEALKAAEKTIKERDKQLKSLQEESGTVEELQQKITELTTANEEADKQHKAELNQIRVDTDVDTVLKEFGSINNIVSRALLGDFLKDAKLDDDNKVIGLREEVKRLSEDEGSSFCFKTPTESTKFKGFEPGNPGGKATPPDGDAQFENMTYSQQIAYMAEHPTKT